MFKRLLIFAVSVTTIKMETLECEGDPPILKTIPGQGYDGLTNEDRSQITHLKYRNCIKIPNTEQFYKIPTTVKTSIVDKVRIDVNIITDWTKYLAVDAIKMKSIKTSVEDKLYRQIDGSFSSHYTQVKKRLLIDNEATVQTIVINHLFTLNVENKYSLSTEFKDAVQNIIDQYENKDVLRARYYADKIVEKFGTYFITQVHVGGMFIEESYFDVANMEGFNLINMELDAKRAFMCEHNFSLDEGNVTSCELDFNENRRNFTLRKIGGFDDLDVEWWIKSVNENMAIINRFGMLLHETVDKKLFPDTRSSLLGDVAQLIQEAVQKYYRLNTHMGCALRPTSESFDNTVNFHDHYLCEGLFKEHFTGGFFQTCSKGTSKNYCEKYTYTNCYSNLRKECPTDYTDTTFILNNCRECTNKLTTHFCVSEDSNVTPNLLFWGLYSPYIKNMLTNTSSCPVENFHVSRLSENLLFVCVSHPFVNAKRFDDISDVSLGGFRVFCNEEKRNIYIDPCPTGYTQHFATMSDECEVYYCAHIKKNKRFKYVIELLNPPYSHYKIPKIGNHLDCPALDALSISVSMVLVFGNLFVYYFICNFVLIT